MPNYRGVPPVIRWGTNLANAVYFPFPMDSVFSGSEPRSGSEQLEYPSGVRDAWRIGTNFVLAGTHRWLSQADTLFYPRCTGWDGALGVRAAIEWMQDWSGNTLSWHSDGRNLVRHSALALSTDAVGGTAGSTTTIYNKWVGAVNGTPTGATVAYNAGPQDWKLSASGSTGSSDVDLRQRFPVIPGESLCLSANYAASGLAGGANGILALLIYDAAGTSLLQTHAVVSGLTSTVFTRASTGFGGAPTPAGAAFAEAILRLTLPNAASGNIEYYAAMVRRDSTDATWIDSPSIDGCYLVEPSQFSPANESDGSRQFLMKVSNPTTAFDGY